MPTPTAVSNPADNRLLAALPRAERERLIPHLKLHHLPRGKILGKDYHVREVHDKSFGYEHGRKD